MKPDNQGFTLSEVLLVLSVIGVVAALTIPTLVQRISNDQYKSAWEKEFAALSQATTLVLINDVNGNFYSILNNNTPRQLYDRYAKYLNIIKSCGNVVGGGPCWSTPKLLNGAAMDGNFFDDGSAVLSDGTSIAFEDPNSLSARYIWIDVNGIRPPNTLGKDVFGVKFYNDGIRPFGSTGDGYENTCTTSGYGCSAENLNN